jgi:hypothetical protein
MRPALAFVNKEHQEYEQMSPLRQAKLPSLVASVAIVLTIGAHAQTPTDQAAAGMKSSKSAMNNSPSTPMRTTSSNSDLARAQTIAKSK